MTDSILHFLLVFDHAAGRLLDMEKFGADGDGAVEAYAAKEREYQGRSDVEIVLIGSDSLDTVRLTHANYFDGTAAVSKYLRGLDALAAAGGPGRVASSSVKSFGEPLPRRRRR